MVPSELSRLRHFSLLAVAIVSLLGLTAGSLRASELDAGAVVLDVKRELEVRGIDLVVAHFPMRYELYPEDATPFSSPFRVPHASTVRAQRENLRLTLRGLPMIGLHGTLLEASTKADIYKDNRFHLQPESANEIGAELYRQLRMRNILDREGGGREVIFVGDCFAADFAESARHLNQKDNIRSLIKYGGGGQAHNHLFAFEDQYLETADVVVWVLGDRNLSGHGFAPLCVTHSEQKLEREEIEARIVQVTEINADQAARMPYPNATRATLFERLDTGEHFVGIDYIARNHKLQLSRMFKKNYRVRLSCLPLGAFEKHNRVAAREVLLDTVNDFESPRYWIQGWLDLRQPEVVQITMSEES